MHIPDGFLSVQVSILFWMISILAVGYALKRVGADLGERQVPMMGVLAAAIFAGQMLNFAVAGGTSGHLIGAALATILLGPWAAMVILTCVISIQALIFQDGGLLVLGANIFNMAIVGVAVSYMVFRTIQKLAGGRSWGIYAGGFAAAWSSVEVAALGTSLELAISGTSPANIAIPAMGGIHALIGIGEGLITVGALAFLHASRRDLLKASQPGSKHGSSVWVAGLLLALLMAIASPLASKHPDGLMWVATQYGFMHNEQSPIIKLIPHYLFPGVENKTLATILAAILGILIVFGAAFGVAYARRRKSTTENVQ
ncbi:MAG: cobalamin biosynthesis protein CbiM [Chloroflexi bacterium RBG_13_50_21]|nr:MAG: cobalamin biosynthesis protein CbiM [Chloroflexi bacterium RBG_13_50_21]